MKQEIESYPSGEATVLEWSDRRAIVRLPRAVRSDQAVVFRHGEQTCWGRVTRQLGSGRVEVQVFSAPDWLPEASVDVEDEQPSLPLPWDVGPVDASSLKLQAPDEGPPWPPRSISMTELSGVRRPFDSGIGPLDLIAPLVHGGFNLVIDASRDRRAFDALILRAMGEVDLDVRVDCEEPGYPARRRIHSDGALEDYDVAMAAALAWIASQRHERRTIEAVMELPVVLAEFDREANPGGIGMASLIGDSVSSTKNCDVTCIVRLPAASGPDGFSDIVETLALGDVDAQIFIDSHGRFDPTRSHSKAPIDEDDSRARSRALSLLNQALRIAERQSIWGSDDIEPEETDAMSAAEAMRVSFCDE